MFHSLLLGLLGAAVGSFVLALLLVHVAHRTRIAIDIPGAVQCAHSAPTPRIGGLGIYLGAFLARMASPDPVVVELLDVVLVSAVPALIAGIAEDITHHVGMRIRLAAIFLSAAIAVSLFGVSITRLDVPVLDLLLRWPVAAAAVTLLGIAGVSNSINIIDGHHGLASGTGTIALAGIAAVAYAVNDMSLCAAAASMAAVFTGFWFVNFPWGKLFLGDGGAYFAGFALACFAVQLPMRNVEVSPWASLLICGYPVTEVLYSIIRRRGARRPATNADLGHLHSLVAVRVARLRLGHLPSRLHNPAVSVLMWLFASVPVFTAVSLHDRTDALAAAAAAYLLLYHLLYRQVQRA